METENRRVRVLISYEGNQVEQLVTTQTEEIEIAK